MPARRSRTLAIGPFTTLVLVTTLSTTCTPRPPSPSTPEPETPPLPEPIPSGERVVSVWTFNYDDRSTVPPRREANYQSEGSNSETTIQGTFRVVEVETTVYPGTAMQYSRFEYRVEGSATGTSKEEVGASRQVQNGFYWTEITECPTATHTETAAYTITGTARNGYVRITVATDDFAGRDDIEKIQVGSCAREYWDQVTDERVSTTEPNEIFVGHTVAIHRSYRAEENWEHGSTSTGSLGRESRWRDWIRVIETMPCVLELNRNPVLVRSNSGGHSYGKLPDGADYQWSITSGGDKARIGPTYGDGQSVDIEIFARSESANDIAVTGTYVGEDGVRRSCTDLITALEPSRLQVLESEELPLQQQGGDWSLGVRRRYQVLDQFGTPIRESGLEVTERLSGIDVTGASVTWDAGGRDLSFNPGDVTLVGPGVPFVTFDVQSWYTDDEGRFDDTVQMARIGMPFPDRTDFLLYQDIFVDGSLAGRFVFHFLDNSVAVAPR